MDRKAFNAIAKGWAIRCNSGASVYTGSCDDRDITDTSNEFTPITVFGNA